MRNYGNLTGILVDTQTNTISKHTIKDATLTKIYGVLHCSTIDIISRHFICGWYDIYIDDEGLLKDNPIMTLAVVKDGKIIEEIVNNIFIIKHDKDGNPVSLDDHDIENVLFAQAAYKDGDILRKAIVAGF